MFSVPSDRICFLDGGGKLRSHAVVAFCGYMAHPFALEEFEQTWATLLRHSGLLDGLHMTDALGWRCERWQALKAQWSDDADAKRAELLLAFATVIRRSPLRGVGAVGDSQYLTEKAVDSKRPDLVLFERTIQTALAGMDPSGTLQVVCDWEDGFDELCVRLLARLRSERPDLGRRVKLIAFADDTVYPELQAADMFAHLALKHVLAERENPRVVKDPLFAILTDPAITTGTSVEMAELIDAETFRRMVEAHRK
jgi:hypothetical protein